jgi:bifunctional DNA-binding transcriptional regulator/antitoxin component of YhaV-PrlF toxin-antitoxin module
VRQEPHLNGEVLTNFLIPDILLLISENMTVILNVRQRGQVTFSPLLLAKMGIGVGDRLVAKVQNNQVVLKPQKQVALDALKELQKIIQESGISEKEMQDNARKIRQEFYLKNYASQSLH